VPERNGWTPFEIDAVMSAAFGHNKFGRSIPAIAFIVGTRPVFRCARRDRSWQSFRLGCLAAEVKKNKGVATCFILSDLSAEYDDLRSDKAVCISVLSSSLAGCAISYCLSSTEAEVLSDCTSVCDLVPPRQRKYGRGSVCESSFANPE
jgi:hypothetical protein